ERTAAPVPRSRPRCAGRPHAVKSDGRLSAATLTAAEVSRTPISLSRDRSGRAPPMPLECEPSTRSRALPEMLRTVKARVEGFSLPASSLLISLLAFMKWANQQAVTIAWEEYE